MSEEVVKVDTKGVFRRLMRMLQPHYGKIGLGLFLLILSGPCEIFPGLVWKFVADDVVPLREWLSLPGRHGHHTPVFWTWFTVGGRITSPKSLLASSIVWLFAVYLLGEILQTIQ